MSHRILIFGGTFDPPHRAHIELPCIAAERLVCDLIIFVPAAISPLKAAAPSASAAQRLAMVERATAHLPNVHVSTVEIDRAEQNEREPSYTIDTVRSLREQYGSETEMHLLIGCDQALAFHQWKDWQRLIELATPAVMLRPPGERPHFEAELSALYEPAEVDRWLGWTLDLPLMEISATEIRRRLAAGEDVADFLPPDVLAYIDEHGLYRASGREAPRGGGSRARL